MPLYRRNLRFTPAILAAAALGLASAATPVHQAESDQHWPEAYRACVETCERQSPEDRGQGCMDIECNPLLGADQP